MPRFRGSYLPADRPCRWLRGNHHGHSTVSDGQSTPADLIKAYAAAGYDYFALSEHDLFLDPQEVQPQTSMCLLPAVETTSCFGQTLLCLGVGQALPARELTPLEVLAATHAAGGLFVFDHPNWQPVPDYASEDLLVGLTDLQGMEIYCGVIERLPGQARATDRWDRLLSLGRHVFGHATDDQHEPGDQFVAWNCVQWPHGQRVTPRAIVQALAQGRFYASTGVRISCLAVSPDGRRLTVESDADEIHWITRSSVIVRKTRSGADTFSLDEWPRLRGVTPDAPAESLYVRAECLGHGNAMAWSQPFWIAA